MPTNAADRADRRRARDQCIVQPLMIPLSLVMVDELAHRAPEVALAGRVSRSKHSSVMDRTNRSAKAFALGARSGVRTVPSRFPS
jgi:hypothetical protein